ncbi:coiled-coil domain-containing protein 174 [Aricia agestis]|uniref:coiled-coil domain-containing protein 174 n=1 Tax=Aricia agestis TaxID=91739 RepID=UPI001C20A8BD|nr:coiled-coil domain-containing protein 174 [Aricia agestis]
MGDENPKKILFNKSILLSLKAELLKKQEEVQEKKNYSQHKIEHFKPKRRSSKKSEEIKETEKNKRSLLDNLKAVDTDEIEACRKSKLALEKKAQLYEHLADGAGDSQLSGRFLVNFKQKKQNEPPPDPPEPETKAEEDHTILDDSDWVEFTDFLGRTRKCLKSDLDYYKERDEKLQEVLSKRNLEENKNTQEQRKVERTLLVQTTTDYLQSLREKWEQKERELLAKDRDIHYQDLLFDEARVHGVGYYSFSTDEDERKRQMEELLRQRKETVQAQEQALEARRKREELVAARVAAARARQRARAGLPPEDPEEKKEEYTKHLLEFLNQQKYEADAKAKEEERKKKEEIEKERQKLREAYVRDWDIGKEGVEDKVKKFREMTQEEYVEQQRSKRIDEFAPVKDDHHSKASKYVFDEHGRKVNTESDKPAEKTWASVRKIEEPSMTFDEFVDNEMGEHLKGLFFTSKKPKKINYKNFVKQQELVPIQNELDNEEGTTEKKIEKRKLLNEGAEIEPPSTFDYYGPVSKHRKPQKPFDSDLSEAFAQGSKSLEPKESKARISKQYDFFDL